jgi:dextranase
VGQDLRPEVEVGIVDFYPTRGMFRPGETVELTLQLASNADRNVRATANLRLTHLTEPVARLDQPVTLPAGGAAVVGFNWSAPGVRLRGYGADLVLTDAEGRGLAAASTAFDVGEHWTLAPRYGFLCNFPPQRNDTDSALQQLAKYHINGVQFYDWQYRHDQLLPPEDSFIDPLGRPLSLTTVRSLIEAAHRHGMATMPYTAIYAASPAFARRHPDWALYDADAVPHEFEDGFLHIMNPAPDSPWTEHLMEVFAAVLQQADFDGIHLDQYGDPKSGYNADGQPVDLASVIPEFIRRTKATATAVRPGASVIFNAVGNWPIERVASAPQDIVYIEVWPPHTSYADLWKLIVDAQSIGGGKSVVLAAYIDPERPRNVRLADAVIFASGGYHIELGEGTGMLADPYFPKYKPMGEELAAVTRRYYDFAVRYENVLAAGTTDTTREVAARLSIQGIETDPASVCRKVWPIARRGQGFEAISLINLLGVEEPQWTGSLRTDPTPVEELLVRYQAQRGVHRLWWASPDFASPEVAVLPFESQASGISFAVPRLAYWDLIVIEFAD